MFKQAQSVEQFLAATVMVADDSVVVAVQDGEMMVGMMGEDLLVPERSVFSMVVGSMN